MRLRSHLYRALWHFILIHHIPTSGSNLPNMGPKGILVPGDLLIGAVIPIHIDSFFPLVSFLKKPLPDICKMFRLEFYQQFQALRYVVEEINRSPDLLPNITLGFYVYDSCSVLKSELQGTLWMLTGLTQEIPNYRCRDSPLAAIIGHSKSTFSILMAHILGLYKFPQVLYYIKKVRVKMSNQREVYFDKDGNPPAVYDIVNWQPGSDGTLKQVKLGSYDTLNSTGNVFSLNTSLIWWGTVNQETPLSVCSQSCPVGFKKVMEKEEPVCCFQCVPCSQGEISNQTDSIDCWKCPWDMWPSGARDRCISKPVEFLSYVEPLGITLAATSVFSSLVPISIFYLFIHYKSTPIVRANNYSVSCILLVSLSFCFLCALAFIGYPQPEKCLLRQAAFGLVFTLCVSCILAKTVIVVFAFMATKPGSSLKKWTTPRVPYMIITICTFVQFLLCVIWLSASPPFPQYNIEAKPGIIVVECNENSQFAFWCMLGYLGFLASVSFTVAFLARRLPDNFNEAKLITFSMLAFLSVWVYFIPASLSAQGMYTVAMEIFAVLTSSWALVVCMFLPKCFIILFRPNMNSRENIMSKSTDTKQL
eukprot:XP_012815746.1 PREDICTED: vomeronasal type-2 receptor 26-like [Xenopus tropicalis]